MGLSVQQVRTNVQSVLAADFGSVNTRLILIDLVDGQYRVISRTQTPTTLEAPLNDVTIGLGRAMDNLQNQIGRSLLDGDGNPIFPEQPDGSGADELIATTSAAPRLKALLVGLMQDMSIETALKALSGTYIEITGVVSISDALTEEAQINAILQASPDLIFLTGGTNGGNTETVKYLIDLVTRAIHLFRPEDLPIILYAGNQDLAPYAYEQIKAALHDHSDVFIAPNIRPSANVEDLQTARLELALVYSNFVSSRPGGFREIATVSKVGVVPTTQSIGNIMRWMNEAYPDEDAGILHIDVGSSTSSITVAIAKKVSANVQSDLGIGHSLTHALKRLNLASILAWIPFPFNETQLQNYAANKEIAPWTIPQTTRELMIEYAIVREIIRALVRSERGTWQHLEEDGKFPTFEPMILSGATLTETAHPAVTAMLLLDALEFEGITSLYIDPFSILPALGAVAMLEAIMAVQVFENQGLTNLGPVFGASGTGRGRGKKPAMRIKIELAGGRVITKDLMPNEIWSAPISPGQQAKVEIHMGRGMKLAGKGKVKRTVEAGVAGIIFDARGRPLIPTTLEGRAAQFNGWWEALTGTPLADWQKFTEVAASTATSYVDEEAKIKALQELMGKEKETQKNPLAALED